MLFAKYSTKPIGGSVKHILIKIKLNQAIETIPIEDKNKDLKIFTIIIFLIN